MMAPTVKLILIPLSSSNARRHADMNDYLDADGYFLTLSTQNKCFKFTKIFYSCFLKSILTFLLYAKNFQKIA